MTKKDRIAALVLILSAFIFLGPSLFTSNVLLPGDIVARNFAIQPTGADFVIHNSSVGDVITQFYPFLHFFKTQVLEGTFPLWNPYILCGAPFPANTVSAVFFPLNWLVLVMPLEVFFEWAALAKLLLAGFGIYLFGRKVGLSALCSAFAAGSYMFGGYQVFLLLFPNTWVSALLGWTLLAAERLIETGRIRFMACLALLTGFSFLAGHVESSLLLAMATGLYCLARNWKRVPLTGVGLVLGFLLAAVVIFPFIEALWESSTYLDRSRFARNPYHLELFQLPLLVVPYALGSAVRAHLPNVFTGAAYTGVLPMFLACFAFFHTGARKIVLPLALVALAAFLLLFGIFPVFDIFTALPVLKQGNHFHVTQLFQGTAALLGGFGLAFLIESRPRKTCLAGAAIVFLALLGYSWWAGFQPAFSGDAAVGSYFFFFRRFPFPIYPALATAVLLAAAVWAGWVRARLGEAALVLTLIGGLTFGMFFNPIVLPEDSFLATPEYVEQMQTDPHARIVHVGFGNFQPNYPMRWKLRDVRGYESVVPGRVPPMLELLTGPNPDPHYFVKELNSGRIDLLRRLGVGLVSSFRRIDQPGLEPLRDRFPWVYRLRSPGRVHFAGRILWVGSAAEALEHVTSEKDPAFVALEVGNGPTPSAGFRTATRPGTVTWLEDGPNRVTVEVETRENRWLVLRDAAYPGWEARIDDEAAPIYRADFLFRAVHVPAGRHRVDFRYRPFSSRLGLVVTLGVLALILSVFAVDKIRSSPR